MFNRGQQALCTDTQVLFLDFDGVLHPEFCNETKHFMHLNAFERTLRKLPTMEIVIV
jgi:hypothetical protein